MQDGFYMSLPWESSGYEGPISMSLKDSPKKQCLKTWLVDYS